MTGHYFHSGLVTLLWLIAIYALTVRELIVYKLEELLDHNETV